MLGLDTATGSVIGVIGAAFLAAAGGWLAARRRFSGKIAQTDAELLWKEAASIRDDYRQRLDEALARLASAEGRLAAAEGDNATLRRENLSLDRRFTDCHARMSLQDATIRALREEIAGGR